MKRKSIHLADALGHGLTDKRIDILRRIGESGSISQAAREAGVSYKSAWQAVETLSNLAGAELLQKAVGGSGGGGAALTAAGQRVLRAARALGQLRSELLRRIEQDEAGDALLATPGVLGMRTSMRNQLPCVVRAVRPAGALVRVELAIDDSVALVSRITRESSELLSLGPGKAVLALFKATAVVIASRLEAKREHNLLRGRVVRASRSAQGGEIALELAAGLRISGFAPAGHGLKKGMRAMAVVEESGVVIGVAD